MKSGQNHKPGFFFFSDDWRADEALSLCSEGARLLWLEMLLIMNKADGYMLVNGHRPEPAQIAIITRTDPIQVDSRLAELRKNGVYSVTKSNVIYSRKMLRDEKKARIARENGKKGGNPTLCKGDDISPSDKGSAKPRGRASLTFPSLPLPYQEDPPSYPSGSVSPEPTHAPPNGVADKPSHSRGTRIPDDWKPSDADVEFAKARGLGDHAITAAAAEFRTYWGSLPGQRGVRLSWSLTWQNNIIKRHEISNVPRQQFAAKPQRKTRTQEARELHEKWYPDRHSSQETGACAPMLSVVR